MSKHTEGPWKHDGRGMYIFDSIGHIVAQVRGWGRLTGHGAGGLKMSEEDAIAVQTANGDLIATAPELLAFAQYVVDNMDPEHGDYVVKAAQLIVKAEGFNR